MLDRLKRKVIPVLPSPWRMLQSVPDIYRNGQTNESARIWLAAISLSKRAFPRKSAKVKKNRKHAMPSRKQRPIVR